tara:strand:+ start:1507 stop:2316 length:810 start_codon:yes stop_codon:yes gene_type:complete
MNYLKIDNVIIRKTNIRSCQEVSEANVRYIFNNYFGKDYIENIMSTENNEKYKFPVLVEFKKVIINEDLKQDYIDKIYEFNTYFKNKDLMKLYVDLNEIWTLSKSKSNTSIISNSTNDCDIKIIKDKQDELKLISEMIKLSTAELFIWNLDSKINLTNTFLNLMSHKSKYEIAEMMGGILDEDDYFVNEYRQTTDMYKKYITRKYKYQNISENIIDEIEENLSKIRMNSIVENSSIKKPPKIKRQCADNEAFERFHGISFDDSLASLKN